MLLFLVNLCDPHNGRLDQTFDSTDPSSGKCAVGSLRIHLVVLVMPPVLAPVVVLVVAAWW